MPILPHPAFIIRLPPTIKLILWLRHSSLVGVLAVLFAVQALCVRRDRRRFPPPGELLNGLHVLKMGRGTPSIVFESGLANSSLSWSLIQPQVASFATTYSYDRAGIGWSNAAYASCSLERITADLRPWLIFV